MPNWDDVVAMGERLPGVEAGTWLAELIEEAWRSRAPKRILTNYDRRGSPSE